MVNNSYTVTEKAREQRRLAARKHGAWSILERGPDAMDNEQRSMYAELQEQLSEHAGVIDALRDQCAQSIMVAQVAADYVSKQAQSGVPLDEIRLLRALPAFWNSAARMMGALLALLPAEKDDAGVLDLLNKYKEGEDDASNH